MKRYYLRCTTCGQRTPINVEEAIALAQVYRSARTIAVGCPVCGGAVEGESEDTETDQERLRRATAEPGYVWSAEESEER